MEKCRHRKSWLKWKDVILIKLDLVEKQEVFRLVIRMSEFVKLVRYNGYLLKNTMRKMKYKI